MYQKYKCILFTSSIVHSIGYHVLAMAPCMQNNINLVQMSVIIKCQHSLPTTTDGFYVTAGI